MAKCGKKSTSASHIFAEYYYFLIFFVGQWLKADCFATLSYTFKTTVAFKYLVFIIASTFAFITHFENFKFRLHTFLGT